MLFLSRFVYCYAKPTLDLLVYVYVCIVHVIRGGRREFGRFRDFSENIKGDGTCNRRSLNSEFGRFRRERTDFGLFVQCSHVRAKLFAF